MGHNPDGLVDDRVGVLRVDDARSGSHIGLLVVCTAHANVLKEDNLKVSADFPGLARTRLREELECPVLFAIGAAGDVNARWRGSVEDLERMSEGLCAPISRLLPELRPIPLERLWISSLSLRLNLLDLPPPEEANRLAEAAYREWGVNAAPWLGAVEKLYSEGKEKLSVEIEVQGTRINEGFLYGIPMEPFSGSALEVRRRSANDMAFLLGYTNGYVGYLPTSEEFGCGGYEVEWSPVYFGATTGLLMPASPESSGRVIEEALRLFRASFQEHIAKTRSTRR